MKILNNETMIINRKLSTEWIRSNLISSQRHTELENLFNCIFRTQPLLNEVTACVRHVHNAKDLMQQIRPIKTMKTRRPRCLVLTCGGVWRLLTQTVQ
jgi:hypothetical protein